MYSCYISAFSHYSLIMTLSITIVLLKIGNLKPVNKYGYVSRMDRLNFAMLAYTVSCISMGFKIFILKQGSEKLFRAAYMERIL